MKRQPKNNDAASPKEPAAAYLLNLNRRSRLFSACPPMVGTLGCRDASHLQCICICIRRCVIRGTGAWRRQQRNVTGDPIQRPSSHRFFYVFGFSYFFFILLAIHIPEHPSNARPFMSNYKIRKNLNLILPQRRPRTIFK